MPKRKRSQPLKMAKRKRTYTRRRRYSRKPSRASIAKAMRDLTTGTEPYGPGSTRYAKYGPSNAQMRLNPGISRSATNNMNRAIDRYYGDGGYFSDAYDYLKHNAPTWGRNIGHWGTRIGGALMGAGAATPETGGMGTVMGAIGGWQSGAESSKAAGWGSYNIGRVTNDLISGSSANGSAPVYHSAGAYDELGDVIISNRELVKLVRSSATPGDFKVEKFTLNPADLVFHHLRDQCSQYEQFEFSGLMFQYVPMTGEGGSNELGVIGMATSYDPSQERSFEDIEQLMRFKGATTCKPSVGMVFGIECDPSKRAIKTMYVRDDVDRPKDFTDPATFYLASQGIDAADQTLGQLWVTYTVKLRNIKLSKRNLDHLKPLVKSYLWPVQTSDVLNSANMASRIDSGVFSTNEDSNFCSVLYPSTSTDNQINYGIKFDRNMVRVGDYFEIQIQAHQDDPGDLEIRGLYPSTAVPGISSVGTKFDFKPEISASDPDYDNDRAITQRMTEDVNIGRGTHVSIAIVKITDVDVDPIVCLSHYANPRDAANWNLKYRISVSPTNESRVDVVTNTIKW